MLATLFSLVFLKQQRYDEGFVKNLEDWHPATVQLFIYVFSDHLILGQNCINYSAFIDLFSHNQLGVQFEGFLFSMT